MNTGLLKILVCPICKTGPLRYEKSSQAESLTCPECKKIYRIESGIPNMLPDGISSSLLKDGSWKSWSKRLDNFILWRKRTWNGSSEADELQTSAFALKERFVEFTALKNSSKKIIDIGCGDGGIRAMLGECDYYGIDPLLIEKHRYVFPIVKGIGEYLPFGDGVFDEVILSQVLDHCNSIDELITEIIRVTGKNGSVNVMQYISKPEGSWRRIYYELLRFYLSVKGSNTTETKMRHFDVEGLLRFFRNRFEEVRFLKYSDSQIFIKASLWKKVQR